MRSANAEDVTRLRRFGDTIGWAFRVTDDILDVEESSAALGKTPGKTHGAKRQHTGSLWIGSLAPVANDLRKRLPSSHRTRRASARLEFLVLRRA